MSEEYNINIPEENYNYKTFVFKRGYKPKEGCINAKGILGDDYQGMTPITVVCGNELDVLEASLDLLRKIRDGESDNPECEVEEFFEKNKSRICYYR